MGHAPSHEHVSRAARLAVASLLTLLWSSTAHATDDMLENAVKATYLLKLAAFVTWPVGALPPDKFVICVVGQTPVGELLDRVVKSQTIQQRPIVVRNYQNIRSGAGCQMMYAVGSDTQSVADALAVEQGAPVLTVTDGQDADRATGIINFLLVAGRVRFEIDEGKAAENGIVISSKLLRLALRVVRHHAG